MLSGRLRRAAATVALLALLGACSQNPQFRLTIADQVYGSLNQLYVLTAAAELGGFRSPSSYPAQAGSYAEVIGGFETGRLLEDGRPVGAGSAGDLDAAIGRCVGLVRQMAERHRTAGIAPGSAATGAVRARCGTAARLVSSSAASSWIFSTAAGDL